MYIFKRKDHPFDESHLRTNYGTRSHCIHYMLRRMPIESRTPQDLENSWDLYEIRNSGCTKIDMTSDTQTKRWVTVHRNNSSPVGDNFPPTVTGN